MKNQIAVNPSSAFSALHSNSKMTSKAIAEATNKRHDNVIRKIKSLIKQGAICALSFKETSESIPGPNGGTRKSPVYSLDFEATMILITGYNAVLRSKVIARWLELERGAAPKPAPVPAITMQPRHKDQLAYCRSVTQEVADALDTIERANKGMEGMIGILKGCERVGCDGQIEADYFDVHYLLPGIEALTATIKEKLSVIDNSTSFVPY